MDALKKIDPLMIMSRSVQNKFNDLIFIRSCQKWINNYAITNMNMKFICKSIRKIWGLMIWMNTYKYFFFRYARNNEVLVCIGYGIYNINLCVILLWISIIMDILYYIFIGNLLLFCLSLFQVFFFKFETTMFIILFYVGFSPFRVKIDRFLLSLPLKGVGYELSVTFPTQILFSSEILKWWWWWRRRDGT